MNKKIAFKDFTFDYPNRSVWVDGREYLLSPIRFKLLQYFIENKNMLLTRELLLEKVWGWQSENETRTVDIMVGYLRNTIGKHHIETRRGFGFKFVE